MNAILLFVVSICYPFLVYYGLQYWQPKYLVAILLVIFLFRLKKPPIFKYEKIVSASVLTSVMVYTWLSNDTLGVRMYPVLMTLLMLVIFGYSLIHPPSMIERFARIQQPDLPLQAVAYTRNVTKVWVAFFSFNLVISLITVIFCSDRVWALYNGGIVYLLMGLLFVVEYLVRLNVRKKYDK